MASATPRTRSIGAQISKKGAAEDATKHIRVVVRIRPPIPNDDHFRGGHEHTWTTDGIKIEPNPPFSAHAGGDMQFRATRRSIDSARGLLASAAQEPCRPCFIYDRVFESDADTKTVYDALTTRVFNLGSNKINAKDQQGVPSRDVWNKSEMRTNSSCESRDCDLMDTQTCETTCTSTGGKRHGACAQDQKSMVGNLLDGIGGCIIAFGPTSSGKTYNIFGNEGVAQTQTHDGTLSPSAGRGSPSSAGIIQLMVDELFQSIALSVEEAAEWGEPGPEYLVSCTYMQIYQKEITDLFAKSEKHKSTKKNGGMTISRSRSVDAEKNVSSQGPRKKIISRAASLRPRASASSPIRVKNPDLQIKRQPDNKGFYVDGLHEVQITSTEELMIMLKKATQNRIVRKMANNPTSSRSHVVFTLNVESQREARPDEHADETSTRGKSSTITRRGRLHIVDLAGSEGLNKGFSRSMPTKEFSPWGGDERKLSDIRSWVPEKRVDEEEAKNINSDLFHLGEVISRLSESKTARKHIPYRDSILTKVLASSLGGNSLTSLLLCLTHRRDIMMQSLTALKFAQKAKSVTNIIERQEIPSEQSKIFQLRKTELLLKAQGTPAPREIQEQLSFIIGGSPPLQQTCTLPQSSVSVQDNSAEVAGVATVTGPPLQQTCTLSLPRSHSVAEAAEAPPSRNGPPTQQASILPRSSVSVEDAVAAAAAASPSRRRKKMSTSEELKMPVLASSMGSDHEYGDAPNGANVNPTTIYDSQDPFGLGNYNEQRCFGHELNVQESIKLHSPESSPSNLCQGTEPSAQSDRSEDRVEETRNGRSNYDKKGNHNSYTQASQHDVKENDDAHVRVVQHDMIENDDLLSWGAEPLSMCQEFQPNYESYVHAAQHDVRENDDPHVHVAQREVTENDDSYVLAAQHDMTENDDSFLQASEQYVRGSYESYVLGEQRHLPYTSILSQEEFADSDDEDLVPPPLLDFNQETETWLGNLRARMHEKDGNSSNSECLPHTPLEIKLNEVALRQGDGDEIRLDLAKAQEEKWEALEDKKRAEKECEELREQLRKKDEHVVETEEKSRKEVEELRNKFRKKDEECGRLEVYVKSHRHIATEMAAHKQIATEMAEVYEQLKEEHKLQTDSLKAKRDTAIEQMNEMNEQHANIERRFHEETSHMEEEALILNNSIAELTKENELLGAQLEEQEKLKRESLMGFVHESDVPHHLSRAHNHNCRNLDSIITLFDNVGDPKQRDFVRGRRSKYLQIVHKSSQIKKEIHDIRDWYANFGNDLQMVKISQKSFPDEMRESLFTVTEENGTWSSILFEVWRRYHGKCAEFEQKHEEMEKFEWGSSTSGMVDLEESATKFCAFSRLLDEMEIWHSEIINAILKYSYDYKRLRGFFDEREKWRKDVTSKRRLLFQEAKKISLKTDKREAELDTSLGRIQKQQPCAASGTSNASATLNPSMTQPALRSHSLEQSQSSSFQPPCRPQQDYRCLQQKGQNFPVICGAKIDNRKIPELSPKTSTMKDLKAKSAYPAHHS